MTSRRYSPGSKMSLFAMWLVAVACFAMQAPSEEPEFSRTWKFQGRSGPVGIMFTAVQNARSLHMSPEQSPSSISQEAGFLSKVLEDLQSMHIEPRSIGWISLRLTETDAIRKAALDAVNSTEWRRAVKNGPIRYYPLVTRFLNETGAYAEWEPVFQRYGLSLNVAGVEKVGMEPFSKLHIPCPKGRHCDRVLVPIDALVQINLIPKAK